MITTRRRIPHFDENVNERTIIFPHRGGVFGRGKEVVNSIGETGFGINFFYDEIVCFHRGMEEII